ncbi:hypothetical protein V2J52_05410 [Georgenia sp. MJ173]|uniref:hypothetical protein n=1 Tax=Georgenia sunbinii TaxID=3117728 RepID=UPI002F25ECEF
MAHPAPLQLPPPAVLPPAVWHQQAWWRLALRGLIAVGLVAGWFQLALTPVDRSVDDLLYALETGEVTSVTIALREPGFVQGSLPVTWEGHGRPGRTSYEFQRGSLPQPPGWVDEGQAILHAAQRAGVDVRVAPPSQIMPSGITWHWAGIAALTALVVLIAGPPPRLATKWAWWWLWLAVPPMMLLFVVLEPLPLWRRGSRGPVATRLTGGWAFLLGIVAAGVLAAVVPGYAEMFPNGAG